MRKTDQEGDFASPLAANGALMIVVGLALGMAIAPAPYPRLMLSAHTLLLGVGSLSILAALLLRSGLSVVGKRSGLLILAGHLLEWVLGASQIAGAVWGTNKALPIAAGQAGAHGGAPWQETLVLVCQIVPSLFLLGGWGCVIWGVLRAQKARKAIAVAA